MTLNPDPQDVPAELNAALAEWTSLLGELNGDEPSAYSRAMRAFDDAFERWIVDTVEYEGSHPRSSITWDRYLAAHTSQHLTDSFRLSELRSEWIMFDGNLPTEKLVFFRDRITSDPAPEDDHDARAQRIFDAEAADLTLEQRFEEETGMRRPELKDFPR